MMYLRTLLPTSLGLALGGCFTAELDPNLGGVFACEDDDDCDDEQACSVGTCQPADLLPAVVINDPEDPFEVPAGEGDRTITVTLTGNLELTPGTDGPAVFGQGHIVVRVDGMDQAALAAGDLGTGVTTDIVIPDMEGVHRVAAQAIQTDGTPYDNPQARATLLVFVVGDRPLVAIGSPWPGTLIDDDAGNMPIEIVVPPSQEFTFVANAPIEPLHGHAHFFYDVDVGDCAKDNSCPGTYTVLASPTGEVPLPEVDPGQAQITALLVDPGHCPYTHPLEPRETPMPCPPTPQPIFDVIRIERGDPAED